MPAGMKSQEYHGTTGLLQVPSAEMDSAGTFRGGIYWVDKAMLPSYIFNYSERIPFDAPCYTIGVTFFRWIQMSYTGTLIKIHPNDDKSRPLGYYNEDRHVNLKMNPLYEGKWWPAVAVGWDDVGNFSLFKFRKNLTTNNFFGNLYVSVTKHFDVKGYEIGAHLSYRYYPADLNKERRGLAGGLTLRPAFFKPLRLVVEWDGIGVNAGADVLLWKHLYAQVALIHGTGFTGGLSYHYRIKY